MAVGAARARGAGGWNGARCARWKSTSELGHQLSSHGDNVASMAWIRRAIAQTQLRTSCRWWGARGRSTQVARVGKGRSRYSRGSIDTATTGDESTMMASNEEIADDAALGPGGRVLDWRRDPVAEARATTAQRRRRPRAGRWRCFESATQGGYMFYARRGASPACRGRRGLRQR